MRSSPLPVDDQHASMAAGPIWSGPGASSPPRAAGGTRDYTRGELCSTDARNVDTAATERLKQRVTRYGARSALVRKLKGRVDVPTICARCNARREDRQRYDSNVNAWDPSRRPRRSARRSDHRRESSRDDDAMVEFRHPHVGWKTDARYMRFLWA